MSELWDLYDCNRISIGKTHERGIHIPKGLYHLVVDVWIISKDGYVLIDKRHPNKTLGGLWECTGGSVIVGEDSRTAAIRELEEELGIQASKDDLILINSYQEDNRFVDTYIVIKDINLNELVFQEQEVVEAKLITFIELCKLKDNQQLSINNKRLSEYFNIIEQYIK